LLRQCPLSERMLVRDGILVIKLWFSVSRGERECLAGRSVRVTR
jgi:polyphosphate kinase 2 (PPK2 family)